MKPHCTFFDHNHMILGNLDATFGQAQSQWFARLLSGGILGKAGFLGKLGRARCAVPLVSPVLSQIIRQEAPPRRREAILAASTTTRGLPSFLPFARAFRRRALTRSAIRLRSSSATANRISDGRSRQIGEVGYLTYGPDAANVLFHGVNDWHLRKRPMVFTTNKPLNEWGKVLHDEDMPAAILDRVLERGRFIHLDGPSGRTRHLNQEEILPAKAERVIISGISGSEFPEPSVLQKYTNEEVTMT
jgi:hypothetical protein